MADAFEIVDAIAEADAAREVVQMRARNPAVYWERLDPFDTYSDREFRNRYRLSKDSVRFVIGLIEDRLAPRSVQELNISPSLQVLVSLRFYAKGCYQLESGDLHGISQPSVSRIVARVSEQIASLLPRFVSFPPRVDGLMTEFYRIARFPQVVGCIDCTHVPIQCPSGEQAMLYINRKGFYSFNVQVVCDAQRRILDIIARWQGSAHDSRIWVWDNCSLKDEFEASRIKGILLGDSGYPCRSYLLTPILDPQTRPGELYNSAHRRTRVSVERCFGEWKGMFKALKNGLRISLPTAKAAIVAMAVLFNIRKLHGEDDRYDTDSDEDADSDRAEDVEEPEPRRHRQPESGSVFRRTFVQCHFT